MRRLSRLFRRTAGAAIIIVTALFLVLLFGKWFIKTAPIENKIRSLLATYAGDAVTIQGIDLTLLPRPGIIVHSVGIAFPGAVTGKLDSVHLYPELLQLLLGRIRIAKVQLVQPDLALELTEHRERMPKKNGRMSPDVQRAKIASVIASIRSFAPELVVELDNGRLAITINGDTGLFVSNLEIRCALPPNSFDIKAAGDVDHWGTVSASGRFLSTDKDNLLVEGLTLSVGRSSFSDLSGRISWDEIPFLEIKSGRSEIFLQDLSERLLTVEIVRNALKSVSSLKGTITLTSFTFTGPLLHPGRGTMDAEGSVADVAVDASILPGPIKVKRGQFKATMDSISLTDARTGLLDTSFTASVLISGFPHSLRAADVSLQGNTGPETVRWVSTRYNLPSELTLRAPLTLSNIRLRWQADGKTSLRGTLQVQKGPLVHADIYWDKQELLVKQFNIQDERSKASITFRHRDNFLDVSFAGNLYEQTFNHLFEQSTLRDGWIQGDLKAHVILDKPQGSIAEGSFEAKEILIPWVFKTPLNINSVRMSAHDNTVVIESSDITLGDHHFTLAGTIQTTAKDFLVDGEIGASTVAIESLQKALAKDAKKDGLGENSDGPPQKKPLPVRGSLRFKADSLSYGKFVLNPIHATIVLAPDEVKVVHLEALFCGITTRGGLSLVGSDVRFDLKPQAKDLQLEPALACLIGKDQNISGVFELGGSISARGKPDALVSSLRGSVKFTAWEGRIYKQLILAKILSALNVSDLLQGKLPDFQTKGLPYQSISIKATIQGEVLTLEEVVIKSSAMNIVGEGVIALTDSTIRMTVLVAPFVTIGQIVSKIPMVNYILQGNLISIPVAVNGKVNDPDVKILPASAIGDSVLGLLKRTVKAPVQVFEPALPEETK
jgi:hypothetical protein